MPCAGQSGAITSWTCTTVGGVVSVASFEACEPTAMSTAPSRGIGVPPPVACASAVPSSSPVVVGGNGSSTVSKAPATLGVLAPQEGVKSPVPSPRGGLFTPPSGWRLPSPCQ